MCKDTSNVPGTITGACKMITLNLSFSCTHGDIEELRHTLLREQVVAVGSWVGNQTVQSQGCSCVAP